MSPTRLIATCVLVLAGCASVPPTAAPTLGSEAREGWPALPATSAEVSELVATSGEDADGVSWALLRGYLHQPLATVHHALCTPDVLVDRRQVDSWAPHVQPTAEGGRTISIAHVVHNIISIEYEVTWTVGALREGSNLSQARYAKTSGTRYIEVLDGSVELVAVDADTTSVEILARVRAPRSGQDEVLSYVRDFFASLAAESFAHPLPSYSEEH